MENDRLLADGIFLIHILFILFVVVGLLVIGIGLLRKWRWVRNFWFRTIHLICIGVVVMESWTGITCPLTTYEEELRFNVAVEQLRIQEAQRDLQAKASQENPPGGASEDDPQANAAQGSYGGSFIKYWLDDLFFFVAPNWVFTLCYSAFGLVVLATWIFGCPRKPWGRKKPMTKAAESGEAAGI